LVKTIDCEKINRLLMMEEKYDEDDEAVQRSTAVE